MLFTGIPAVSADAVSTLHKDRAKGRRGGNGNRLFKMLFCWYRGRQENESDMIRLRAVLETCLQDGDEDLLEVCGDELGWTMLVRLAAGFPVQGGCQNKWQLEYLAMEALSIAMYPPPAFAVRRKAIPPLALRRMVSQLYTRNPLEQETAEQSRFVASLCGSTAEVICGLVASGSGEELLSNTQAVWGLCWLRGLTERDGMASQQAQGVGQDQSMSLEPSANDCLRLAASSADAAILALIEAGRIEGEKKAQLGDKCKGELLEYMWKQREWLLSLSILYMAPIEKWGLGNGENAAVVLERGGLRRLVFDRWEANGPMFVQTETTVSPAGALVHKYASVWYLKVLLALAVASVHVTKLLLVGLGGGSLAFGIHQMMKDTWIQVLELEKSVAKVTAAHALENNGDIQTVMQFTKVTAAHALGKNRVAFTYFGLPQDGRIHVKLCDVFAYVENVAQGREDRICFDCILFDIHTSDDGAGELGLVRDEVMDGLALLLRDTTGAGGQGSGVLGIYCGRWQGGDFEDDERGGLAQKLAKSMRARWGSATILVCAESEDDESCIVINKDLAQGGDGALSGLGWESGHHGPGMLRAALLPFDLHQLFRESRVISQARPSPS